MIVHCPSCSSRNDIPVLTAAGAATVVDCVDCGHDWIEGSALPAVVEARAEAAGRAPASEPEARQLVEAARAARRVFEVRRRRRRTRQAAWAGLGALALAPLAALAAFPDQAVTAVPASIRIYDWAGLDVNIYGLEIRQVELQHLIVDGRQVIAVKGELANTSSGVRKIPWLRFGLRSKDNAEVYHWTLDTQARPLRPGESTGFVTRLASPPSAASNIEIRFARADEIGSNTAHE